VRKKASPTPGLSDTELDLQAPDPEQAEGETAHPVLEAESSESKSLVPAEMGAQAQFSETAHQQPYPEESKQSEIKPETGQKSGGKRVAENKENVFEGFTKMSESVFSLEGLKKAATWYIETSEKIANQALDLQEKATSWAKYTPLAPLFEAQQSIARKLVERSASAARTLWQISNQ
jgi:hypothetical protein